MHEAPVHETPHRATRPRRRHLFAATAAGLLLALAGPHPAAREDLRGDPGTDLRLGAPPAAGEEAPQAGGWRRLEDGLELGVFASPQASPTGDSLVRVLRIDPGRFDFHLLNASASADGRPRTARGWCESEGMVAAVNASMYQADHRTSVSLMKTGGHVNNSHLSKDMTVLAFDPVRPDLPAVALLDRECDDFDSLRDGYATLVQSIRMVSCRGKNVWSRQPRRWSTAAIAADRAGRVLFVHVRSPYSTHDLIDVLRALPLGIARAMYVEGGPEAQLYVRAGGETLEFVGSFETGFNENDEVTVAWPVPNVVAIRRRGGEGSGG